MIAITGGAGFIGSHLVERLLEEGHEAIILDNLSSGRKENIPGDVEFLEADIRETDLASVFENVDTVFHFAANPKVNTFPENRNKDFDENLEGTKKVIDACVDADVEELVFASSSVVYGENVEIPTPETAEFDPISMYAATKCGAEHMCRVYSRMFDIDLTILRYANIVGQRNGKGVIYDFVRKLEENPGELEILGNGKQRKSYLHIDDAVDATLEAWNSAGTVYNIGSEDSISVDEIAEIVADVMDLEPEFTYTGGDRGWKGDVPEMRLAVEKLKSEGWKPENNSAESVRRTASELIEKNR